MEKTIKQILNLKSVKSSPCKVWIWTAKFVASNWQYGWYLLNEMLASPTDYMDCKRFEFKIENLI